MIVNGEHGVGVGEFMEMDAFVRAGRGAVATAGRWRGDDQRPESDSSGTRWRLPLLTKRTPGVAGVVGSGARQHPRPKASGQAHVFSSSNTSSAKRSWSEACAQIDR